jgi:hypothetical protein
MPSDRYQMLVVEPSRECQCLKEVRKSSQLEKREASADKARYDCGNKMYQPQCAPQNDAQRRIPSCTTIERVSILSMER